MIVSDIIYLFIDSFLYLSTVTGLTCNNTRIKSCHIIVGKIHGFGRLYFFLPVDWRVLAVMVAGLMDADALWF